MATQRTPHSGTPAGLRKQRTPQRSQEQQERIERVKQDLAWAIEQTVRDIKALEEALADRKRQEGGAG